jgi:hypothetical protein
MTQGSGREVDTGRCRSASDDGIQARVEGVGGGGQRGCHKEPQITRKRAPHQPQKSPISTSKEPQITRKRAPDHPQKSPISTSKEPQITRITRLIAAQQLDKHQRKVKRRAFPLRRHHVTLGFRV